MTTDREVLLEEDRAAMVVERCNGANLLNAWAAKRPRMTLNQFSSFAAVAKHLSLTKASAELRVSQPSITQQLKQLEEHYGRQLYRRLSRGIEITEAGQVFLRKIMPILEQIAKLENGFNSSTPEPEGQTLRIGGTFSSTAFLLPSLLSRFQNRFPRAQLELRTGASVHLERLVLGPEMDLAVIAQRARSQDLISEPLRRERLVCFAPAHHQLAKKNRVEVSDLSSEPLIIRGGKGIAATTEIALKQFRDRGWEINIAMRCDDPMAIKAAVRHGMGIGVGFEETVKAEIASGEFKVLKVCGLELEGESFIVYPKKHPLSPLAQEFLKLLREARAEALPSKAKSKVGVEAESQSRSALRMKLENDAQVNAIAAPPELPAGQFATFLAESVSASVPSRTAATTTLLFGFLAQPFLMSLQMINAL